MIKKSTLLVLVCAAVLGGVFYYLNKKHDQEVNALLDTSKPAFQFSSADVTSLTVGHPAKPGEPAVRMEKSDGNWKIVQPIETAADSSVVDGSLSNLTFARSTQTEPGTPDRLKAYGLDPAKVSVTFQLKSGSKHTLVIGEKVFDGDSVYAIADGNSGVLLLPGSVLTSSDKSLDDWRDHSVLHIVSNQVKSFSVKSASGELAAAKIKDQWNFTKPMDARADHDSIDSLLSSVQNAKFTMVASEAPDELAKYGLTSPAVTFTATDDTGKQSTVAIGKKDGSDYFARDPSRPMIFHVNSDFYAQVTKAFADLRDKKLLRLNAADVTRIEIHNEHGNIIVNGKGDDMWVIESPENLKGKNAPSSMLFDPLTALRSDKIIDHPAAGILSKVAKPDIQVTLTYQDKRTVTVRLSKPEQDVVYGQVSGDPAIYTLKKPDFDPLNYEASSLVQ
ncbi:MAG: DUF4340 domain-containing protein [Candidatus Acidiferrales bacterium]|jgi:hypothetical protein